MWGKSNEAVVDLLKETNSLLRELIVGLGRYPQTPRAGTPKTPPRDASSVMRVTRQDVIRQEREAAEKLAAPWRSGPEPSPMQPLDGGASMPMGASPSDPAR